MSRNRYNGKIRNVNGQKARASKKTMAIISVCAIILGIFITAQEYLDRHTRASLAARTAVTEALDSVSEAIPGYVETLKKDSDDAKTLTQAAELLSSDTFSEKSDAYRSVASVLANHSSDKSKSAEALKEALETAEDAAVAYNQEAQAVNEKIVKFPYNIVARIGGYSEFIIFSLN